MWAVTNFEIMRNLKKWTTLCLILFLVFSIIIIQLGIEKFKIDEKQKKLFIEVQVKRIDGFISYHQYGAFGIDRLLLGCPLIALFYNSCTFNDLQANVEISTRHKLYRPEMGKNLFARPTGGNLDFSWYFLIFFSGIISTWSFFAYRNRGYITFLQDFTNKRKIYIGIFLARVIILITLNAIIFLTAWLQFLINGITLAANEISGLLYFFLVAAVMMIIIMAIVSACGAAKNLIKGIIMAISFWLIIVFIWPEAINAVFSRKAEMNFKSLEEYQMQKNEKYLTFEKKSLEETGRYKSQPERDEFERKQIEEYWNVISMDILKIDLEMIGKIEEISRDFQFWCMFNPVTFFKATNNELGSKGYNAYNKFYRENLKIQRGFLRHVFNKRYYENYTKVEPYLPNSELIVESRPGLPHFFNTGLIINFFYIVLAFLFGYKIFKGFMIPKPAFPGKYDEVVINADYGNIESVSCDNDDLANQVTNVFNGYSQGFNGKITVGDQDIVNTQTKNIYFVPNQANIPGHFTVKFIFKTIAKMPGISKEKLQQLIQEYKGIIKERLCHLEPGERTCLLLALGSLKGAKIYILRNFERGIHGKSLLKIINKLRLLKEYKYLVLFLSDIFMSPDKSYNYSYDRIAQKYVDLENFAETIQPQCSPKL